MRTVSKKRSIGTVAKASIERSAIRVRVKDNIIKEGNADIKMGTHKFSVEAGQVYIVTLIAPVGYQPIGIDPVIPFWATFRVRKTRDG